ncbi:hypothetical protein [Methanosarcina mazei]|uniref:hypothetical protein n=1 Tax=Methanosarcina mazei TaxID=2209 RepID=UPI0012D4A8BC|nr:hypothetical protein [Methanosarcina mazei]
MHQKRCIRRGASEEVHQKRCIRRGASEEMHQKRCIRRDTHRIVFGCVQNLIFLAINKLE